MTMTMFNLRFFAKGESGGGGGGAGGGGTRAGSQKTTKQEYHGSAGGSGSSTGGSRLGSGTKRSVGEAVTSVRKSETYEVYRIENGKEEYVKDRDGGTILEKMRYDKNRNAWINSQGRRYAVRKKK